MSRKLLVIRPEPGNAETVSAARKLGLDVVSVPLQQVVPVAWELPDGDFDGLLVGSANVFRHGGEQLHRLRALPVHAVGERTAEEARVHGFSVGTIGKGGLQSVLDTVEGEGPLRSLRLLRLGGEQRVPLDGPDHIEIVEQPVYRLEPLALSDEAVSVLQAGPCVMLHSVGSTHVFLSESQRVGVDISQITLIALGKRIADAAGTGWQAVEIASEPNDMALLALARRICH